MNHAFVLVLMAVALLPAATADPLPDPEPEPMDHCEEGQVHVEGVGCVDPDQCPPLCPPPPP